MSTTRLQAGSAIVVGLRWAEEGCQAITIIDGDGRPQSLEDAQRKGDTHCTASGREVVARSGSWRLDASVPGNLNTQIRALLTKLPSDPTIWRELSEHHECDVFCGLFMQEGNEGTELSPEVMSMLGARGLRLGLDIYDGSD